MKINYFLIFSLLPFLLFAQPGSESAITPINSVLTYQGFGEAMPHLGTGEYKIYYDNVDGVLDKPVFFVDGFDPDDGRKIPDIFNYLGAENFGEDIRDEGFDIVILNFPVYMSASDNSYTINGGVDFIQRNAYTLRNLIDIINASKVGSEENVVIGPSMGGLISRYALRDMEEDLVDHETRLFISFDSPHYGANVPIGLQYLLNFLVNNDDAPVTTLEPAVNGLLNSPAAKQMLVDHYLGHLQGGSNFLQDPSLTLPIGAPDFRDAFQNELNTKGFPQDCRNVAMINGSGLQATNGTPGMSFMNNAIVDLGNFAGFDTRAVINLNFTPAAGNTNTVTSVEVQINIVPFPGWTTIFSYTASAESPAVSDGLDSAPGGQFDITNIDDGSDPILTDFVNNLGIQYFDFIPTLSALSIPEPNWYAAPVLASSPFAATYIPDNNEPHISLTPGNVNFAYTEITSPPLSVSTFAENTIKLEKNPIKNEIVVLNEQPIDNAQIRLVDLTGKVVYSNTMNLSNRTSIPVNMQSGIYIFSITNDQGFNFITKVAVK
ncbi:T9SS type A sorting domain-containing protein [Winogradskyella sp. 3972H.M.0a.05]|uniref:T9SS type A sorting domain-containing protein n=1 Tax=Winogradskyella sp. 3972H.M.0a.05 TaxID=2950277 RepID=UPI003392F5DA